MGNLQRRSNPRTVANLNAASFAVFQKDVTNAGTAEQIHTGLLIGDGYVLVIKAKSANTGNIEIGETKAIAEGSAPFILDANESISLRVRNADLVWIDVTVNGEGVECIVEQDL